jgi:hypothetical protein
LRKRDKSQIAVSPALSMTIEWSGARGGVSGLAMAHPALAETWVELRPWLDLGDGWKLGGMVGLSLVPDAQGLRTGVFTSGYRVALPIVKEVFLGAEIGLETDLPATTPRPYAGVNLGFGF